MRKKTIIGIIRRAKLTDIDAILKIEETQSSNPWKKTHFVDEISNNLSYFLVLEEYIKKEIIGFIIFWIIEDVSELHNIAISESYKRNGHAISLINYMFEFVKKKTKEIFLEVRTSNLSAINLYKKLKFKEITVRQNYYKNPIEDALVFKKNIC